MQFSLRYVLFYPGILMVVLIFSLCAGAQVQINDYELPSSGDQANFNRR